MHNDDSRKRKAAQAANTSSKKHKTDSPTTSRVTLDTPIRPATRSILKSQPASTATRRRDVSPGPSQPAADTHRTRSKTGSLKLKKRLRSPSEDRTPPPASGLSQWVAEMQRQKLRENANSRSSPGTSLTKKRQKAPPKPPPKSEEVIVISSDEDENPRPRKRTRRHTTQVSEIIDLSKDNTPPLPRSQPSRPRPVPLPTPNPVASPSTPASSASPSKYLDLRRLSFSKSKSKTTSSRPRPQTQSPTQSSSWPLKTKLPAAPSPAEMRRKRLNDKFADDDERGSPASKLPSVEVVITRCKPASQPTLKTKFKPNVTPKIEPEPEPELELERNPSSTHAAAGAVGSVFEESRGGKFERGRMVLSKELRARLQDEEEEEEGTTSPALPIDSTTTTATTSTVTGDVNVDDSSTKLVIKTEDIEDTYIDYQPSIPNLREEEEESVVVKEEPPFVEPSPIPDQLSPPWVDEQEQNDLEEAIFQSMLVASAVEAGVPLENQEGELEERDGSSTVPTDSPSSAPMDDASSVRDLAQPETQVVLEEAEKGEDADQEVEVGVKVLEVEKVSEKVPTDQSPCPPTPTPAPDLDFNPYLDFELEQQEQADLEEALFQSQLATVYSSSISKCEDEDKSGMDEQGQGQVQVQDQEQQVDVAVPHTPTPTGNLNAYEEDVFVIEDPDDPTSATNEIITPPSTDDQITHQSTSHDITEAKDDAEEEATASLARVLFPEFSVPLHQAAAPGPFSCSVPTTTLAKLVPTGSTSSVFVAGQLTQRFFAQSCLPPKAKTRAAKPVEVEVMKPVLVEEVQKEELLVEVPVQSKIEQMQVEEPLVEVLVQSEHEEVQSLAGEMGAEKAVEELQMQMPVGLDVDVPDVAEVLEIEDVEVEMGVLEAEVEIKCEEGNEEKNGEEREYGVPVSNVVPIPSTADGNGEVDVEMAVLPVRDREASASPSPNTLVPIPLQASDDEDVETGVVGGIQEVLTTSAASIAVPGDTQASEDDVVFGVAQEAEDEVHQVETASVTSPQTTEDIDMIEPTLQPEFEPASSEQTEVPGAEATPVKVKAMTTEALEKDPILSRALHGSRVLLEIIRGVISKPKPEPEVAPSVIPAEGAGDRIVHPSLPRTSTPELEAPSPIGDHSLPDEESLSSQKSTSELLVEDTDDDTSRRSADVSPSSLQVAEKLTPEPLEEAKGSGDAPRHHVPSSPRARTSTPEPSIHQTEDVIAAPSGPLEVSLSPRPQNSTPESPVFVDNAEGNVTGETLEPELKDEDVQLPPTPTSIHNSPSQSLNHLPVEDEPSAQHNPAVLPDEEPCIQSTIATSDKPSAIALDPQRRTISNTGSESSLATLDDSPPPSTPPQSAFEAYYIRSTSPDDDLGPDIFSKLMDIPSFPPPESDEDDDEYLLSLNFSYPTDLDIVG